MFLLWFAAAEKTVYLFITTAIY